MKNILTELLEGFWIEFSEDQSERFDSPRAQTEKEILILISMLH